MKFLRTALLSLFCVAGYASLASAQSFWEHKAIYTLSGFVRVYSISAADTNDYIFGPYGFAPARTSDYGSSWNFAFNRTPRINYNLPVALNLTPKLLLLGANDEYTTRKWTSANSYTLAVIDVGHILRSSDGGLTWSDTAIGLRDTTKPHNPIGAMAALDSNHIFIPVSGEHFLVSSNGGITWDTTSSPVSIFYAGSEAPVFATVNPIAAYPAPNTLIVAEITGSGQGLNSIYTIFRSTDLGRTWSSGFKTTHNISKFAFVNPIVGYATGFIYDNDGTGNATSTIDKTTDGGLTWSNVYTHRFSNAARLYGIAFADGLHGIAVGDKGTLIRTVDGGNSWEEMLTDFSTGRFGLLGSVAYPDSNHAIVASSTGEALIFRPDTLLDLPVFTNPASLLLMPQAFTASWKHVIGATSYAVGIILNNTVVFDTVVADTSLYIHGLVNDRSNYTLSVQARNDRKSSNTAYVGFFNQGVAGVQGVGPSTSPTVSIQCYPNPASREFQCEVTGFSSELPVVAELDDLLGHAKLDLSNALRLGRSGPNSRFTIDASGLPAGVYVVRLFAEGRSFAQTVLLLK